MKKRKKKREGESINGLSVGHVAQIIRRKMIQKSIASKKRYNRKKKNTNDLED